MRKWLTGLSAFCAIGAGTAAIDADNLAEAHIDSAVALVATAILGLLWMTWPRE